MDDKAFQTKQFNQSNKHALTSVYFIFKYEQVTAHSNSSKRCKSLTKYLKRNLRFPGLTNENTTATKRIHFDL